MVQDKEEIVHTSCECDNNYSKKKFKYTKEKNIFVSRLKYLLIVRGSCLNPVNAKGIMGGCDPHSQASVLQMRVSVESMLSLETLCSFLIV